MPSIDIIYLRDLFDLSDEKSVITEGGGGIGLAISLGFKEYGVSELILIEPLEKKLKRHQRFFEGEMLISASHNRGGCLEEGSGEECCQEGGQKTSITDRRFL